MSASLKNALVNIAGELDTMTDDDSFTLFVRREAPSFRAGRNCVPSINITTRVMV